jgi:hypothetical protein
VRPRVARRRCRARPSRERHGLHARCLRGTAVLYPNQTAVAFKIAAGAFPAASPARSSSARAKGCGPKRPRLALEGRGHHTAWSPRHPDLQRRAPPQWTDRPLRVRATPHRETRCRLQLAVQGCRAVACGQLRIDIQGESLGVRVCHCLACQRPTGSVFAALAAFALPSKLKTPEIASRSVSTQVQSQTK